MSVTSPCKILIGQLGMHNLRVFPGREKEREKGEDGADKSRLAGERKGKKKTKQGKRERLSWLSRKGKGT